MSFVWQFLENPQYVASSCTTNDRFIGTHVYVHQCNITHEVLLLGDQGHNEELFEKLQQLNWITASEVCETTLH